MTEGFPKEAREAARERCEKATEGEWGTPTQPNVVRVLPMQPVLTLAAFRRNEDAEFVAHARTDLPRALDLIDTQEQRIRELEEEHEKLFKVYDIGVDVSAFLLPEEVDEGVGLGFVVLAFRDALKDVAPLVNQTEPTTPNEVEEEK